MYRKTWLENGIRVVTEAVPQARSVALGVLIDAGPRDETPEQSGLAHLAEHVMFQGTSSRDALQIARLMDMAGGHTGAFTARDYTCYYATVLDDYRTYAIDLLGDILLNSTFPPDSVEREKQAVLREIDSVRDVPEGRVNNLLKAFGWPDHPLGRPVAGRPETVRRLTRADLIYFVHEHYLPNRLIVAAAGRVEHDDFVAQVRDAFWRLLGRAPAAGARSPGHRAGVVVEHCPLAQAYFALGVPAPPYQHGSRYGLHVLNTLLGGGVSSRLFRRIREERGLVYHIASEYHAYRDAGMLVVEGSTAPEHLRTVLGLTLAELWRVVACGGPPDDEEVWKAKMHLRGQHLLGAESTHTRMSRLATQELYFGRHLPTEEILAGIDAVDARGVQGLAEEFLGEALSRVTVAVVGPEAPQHYSARAVEDLLAEFSPAAGPREAETAAACV
jgi:predicted Zn-dependent peptidase